MKYVITASLLILSACSSYEPSLQDHLEAERDFHAHQQYLEYLYTTYDSEYIADCLYYVELVCEFEDPIVK